MFEVIFLPKELDMNKLVKAYSRKKYVLDDNEVVICELKACDPIAILAIEISKHMCFATAETDGEDSAGRQKLRLLTPKEIATRSCDIAQEMWNQFESRGMTIDLPDSEDSEDGNN